MKLCTGISWLVLPCRGCSGLLYSSVELKTPDRQLSQAVLFQQEACLIREAFNQRFDAAQIAKKVLIAAVEERLTRISQIEQELGLPSSASTVSVLVMPVETRGGAVLERILAASERQALKQLLMVLCKGCSFMPLQQPPPVRQHNNLIHAKGMRRSWHSAAVM